jgi:diguanylate cyclase (GGDEF)-like protein/PAS domain S-box-containing protein
MKKGIMPMREKSMMERGARDGGTRRRSRGYDLLFMKYKLLFDNARDIILFIDREGKILEANHAAVRTYGYTLEELTSLRVFDLRKFDSRELVESQMRQAKDSSVQFETIHKTKDGTAIPVEVSSTGVDFRGRLILMSIVRDISAKQAYLAEIHRLAYYDELTGLANRKSFRDALARSLGAAGTRCAVLLMDVDDFKRVNDLHSHCVGDRYLAEIARRSSGALNGRGEVFRLGGDEFTALIGVESREDAKAVAESVSEACRGPFEIDGIVIESSVSIGIALFPDDGTDGACILKKADLAMYAAKKAGKGHYSFA